MINRNSGDDISRPCYSRLFAVDGAIKKARAFDTCDL